MEQTLTGVVELDGKKYESSITYTPHDPSSELHIPRHRYEGMLKEQIVKMIADDIKINFS